ncbi:MAG: DUF5658 family protein [Methanolinea sp.]|jgi:NADH:ubiquinone oxidoreductase subunit H
MLVKSDIPVPLFFNVVMIYILFALDVVTTDQILSMGGYEINTLMAYVVQFPLLHLVLKGLVLLFIASVAVWSEEKVRYSGISTLLVVICWYGFVIANNVTVLIALCSQTGGG